MKIINKKRWPIIVGIVLMALIGCSDQMDEKQHQLSFGETEELYPVAENAPTWPEHWMVVKGKNQMPYVAEFDRDLISARIAFRKNDFSRALSELNHAISWLRKERVRSFESHFSEYSKAIGTIHKLTKRINSEEMPSLDEFDSILEKAYPQKLSFLWSIKKAEKEFHYMKQPSLHFAHASYLLDHKHFSSAAKEVRRGADWLTLVVLDSVRREDRNALHKAIAQLRQVANEMESGDAISLADLKVDLKDALATADRSYAFYYLHWAERDFTKNALSSWVKTVDAVADEFVSSTKWMSQLFGKGARSAFRMMHSFGSDLQDEESKIAKNMLRKVRSFDERIAPKWEIIDVI